MTAELAGFPLWMTGPGFGAVKACGRSICFCLWVVVGDRFGSELPLASLLPGGGPWVVTEGRDGAEPRQDSAVSAGNGGRDGGGILVAWPVRSFPFARFSASSLERCSDSSSRLACSSASFSAFSFASFSACILASRSASFCFLTFSLSICRFSSSSILLFLARSAATVMASLRVASSSIKVAATSFCNA